MRKVRVLVGTREGAFILTLDGKREKWDVSGPHFAGWEMYHLKASPVDPNRIYASQTSGWFGQIIQRSDDGGETWIQPSTPPGEQTGPGGMPKGESNKFVYDTSAESGKRLTTHQFYDGKQHPWEFKRVWHIEPSLTEQHLRLRFGGRCIASVDPVASKSFLLGNRKLLCWRAGLTLAAPSSPPDGNGIGKRPGPKGMRLYRKKNPHLRRNR
jgi:hypothetical protein